MNKIPSLLPYTPSSRLLEREDRFTNIITNHAMDSHGIVRVFLRFDSLEPLREGDIPRDGSLCPQEFSPEEFHNYEDSAMATGAFLAAMALKYRATREQGALEAARRAFSGIVHIYHLGEPVKPGFFPKPYAGRVSKEISRDQYLFTLAGLEAYAPVARAKERSLIAEMASRMCRHWIDVDYQTSYFLMDSANMLADYMGSLFLGMMHIGWRLSNDVSLLREYDRLCSELALDDRMPETLRQQFRNGCSYDGGMFFRQNENPLMMKCIAIDALWDADSTRRKKWQRALHQFWNDEATISLDRKSGLNYFIVGYEPQTDSTYLTSPGVIETLQNPLDYPELTWGGMRQRAGSAQTAFVAAVIGDRLKNSEASNTAMHIIESLDEEKFRGLTAPSENHIPPGKQWQANTLNVGYLSMWLWALRRLIAPHAL